MEFQDGTSFIKTQNLVKQYGRRRVVKGVNMELRAGEIVGLLGPNGAGKTTSFYMIVGLVPATEGKVFLAGADITGVPMYKRARMGIGYLPQEASVFRKLTVRQNILAVAEYLPIPKGELKDFVQSMLEGAQSCPPRRPAGFHAFGRRAQEARNHPRAHGAPEVPADGRAVQRRGPHKRRGGAGHHQGLKSKNIGVLITDHNVRETLSIVDRAYLIHDGKVLCEGTSDFLVNDEQSRKFYLGENFSM